MFADASGRGAEGLLDLQIRIQTDAPVGVEHKAHKQRSPPFETENTVCKSNELTSSRTVLLLSLPVAERTQ